MHRDTEMPPALEDHIGRLFTKNQFRIRAGKTVPSAVSFFVKHRHRYQLYDMEGADRYFVSDWMARLLRSAVRDYYHQLQKELEPFDLIAVVQSFDGYGESVKDLKLRLQPGSIAPFIPKRGQPEALIVAVSMREIELLYQWSYVRGEGDVAFAYEPAKTESLHIPGRTRLGGMWPL